MVAIFLSTTFPLPHFLFYSLPPPNPLLIFLLQHHPPVFLPVISYLPLHPVSPPCSPPPKWMEVVCIYAHYSDWQSSCIRDQQKKSQTYSFLSAADWMALFWFTYCVLLKLSVWKHISVSLCFVCIHLVVLKLSWNYYDYKSNYLSLSCKKLRWQRQRWSIHFTVLCFVSLPVHFLRTNLPRIYTHLVRHWVCGAARCFLLFGIESK